MKTVFCLFSMLAAITISPCVYADHHNEMVDLTGVWHATASTDDGSKEVVWTFKKDGGKLKGVSLDLDSQEERDLDRVTVKGKSVTLEIDVEQDGIEGMIRVEAKLKSPGKLEGMFEVVGDDGTEYMSGEVVAEKEVAFAGVWEAVSILPDGQEIKSQMKLSGDNAKLKGMLESENGEIELEKAVVKDKALRLEFEFDMEGNALDIVIKADSKGPDKLVGKWVASGDDGNELAEGDWSAVRKPQGLAGLWNVVATIPDSADYKGTLTLKGKKGSYSGASTRSDGKVSELTKIDTDGNKVVFSVPFEQDGISGIVTVTAEIEEDGSLDGEWVMTSDGQEVASDSWKATRAVK